MPSCQKWIKDIDYFGKPVQITFDKQKKFKTTIGGILSLIIFGLILSLIVTNGLNLLNRKQPKTSATSIYQVESPIWNLSDSKNVFAAYFLTKEYDVFFDPSYVNFEILEFTVRRDANGTSDIYSKPLTIKNCSMYYDFFKERNFEEDFIQNNLYQGICFDVNERDLILGGKYTGEYFSNIFFQFNRCRNKSNENDSSQRRILNEFNSDTGINENGYDDNNPKARKLPSIGHSNIINNLSSSLEYKSIFPPTNNKILRKEYRNKYLNRHIYNDHSKMQINKNRYDSDSVLELGRNLNDESKNSNNSNEFQSYIKSKQYYKDSNIICKSNEEINEKLRSGYLELFYIDQNIDLNNFEKPFQEFFSGYFLFMDPGSRKFVDLFFKRVNITSDAGFLFETPKVDTGLVFDYFREQSETTNDSESIVELYINSSNNVLKYNIIYLKFQDFAASIGGLMNVLIQVGIFLSLIFNDHKMNEKIINTLFDVSLEDESINTYRKSLFEASSVTKRNFSNNKLNLYNNDNLLSESYEKNNIFRNNFLNSNNNGKKSSNMQEKKYAINVIYSLNSNINNPPTKDIPMKKIHPKEKDKDNDIGNQINKIFNIINKVDLVDNNQKSSKNIFTEKQTESHQPVEIRDKAIFRESFSSEKTKQEFLKKIKQLNKLNKKKFSFNFFEIINFYVCPFTCSKKLKNQTRIFNLSKSKLFKYLDFLEIVNHLQEFNKLKKIIFSKSQLNLFRIHQRPKITNQTLVDINTTYYDNKDDQYFLDLLNSYSQALKKAPQDEKLHNLIKFVDYDLKSLFDEFLFK